MKSNIYFLSFIFLILSTNELILSEEYNLVIYLVIYLFIYLFIYFFYKLYLSILIRNKFKFKYIEKIIFLYFSFILFSIPILVIFSQKIILETQKYYFNIFIKITYGILLLLLLTFIFDKIYENNLNLKQRIKVLFLDIMFLIIIYFYCKFLTIIIYFFYSIFFIGF